MLRGATSQIVSDLTQEIREKLQPLMSGQSRRLYQHKVPYLEVAGRLVRLFFDVK